MSTSRSKTRSISFRLLLVICSLLLASFVAIITFVGKVSYENALDDQKEYLASVAKGTALSLSQFIEDEIQLVKTLAASKSIVQALKNNVDEKGSAQTRLADFIKANDGLWSLYAFDHKGRVIAGSTSSGIDERNKDKTKHFVVREILQGKNLALDPKASQNDEGHLIFRLAVAVYDDAGNNLGGLQMSVKIKPFTSKFIDPVKLGETGYPFILDRDHRVLAHPVDKSLVLKSQKQFDFIRKIVDNKHGTINYVFQDDRKLAAFETEPLSGWIITVNASEQEMLAHTVQMRNVIIIMALCVCLMLCLILTFLLRRMIVKPILEIQGVTRKISEGQYSALLEGKFSCELAELADDIQAMRDKIKTELSFAKGVLTGFTMPCAVFAPDNTMIFVNTHMIKAIGREGQPEDYLGQTSGAFFFNNSDQETLSTKALQSNVQECQEERYKTFKDEYKFFNVTSSPLIDMDGCNQGVLTTWFDLTQIRKQQQQVEEKNTTISSAATMANKVSDQLAAAATELAAQVEESSRGSEMQKIRITETATAVEQMNSSILEVAHNSSNAANNAENSKSKAEEGASVVNESIEAIENVRSRVLELSERLGELGEQAEGIGSVINIISDIADQTNLLALNAAIEAARAGDAGRGFAVVADEVRNLAEKTMTATKEVDLAITAIQNGTRNSIESAELAERDVQLSVVMAKKTGEALHEIVGVSINTLDMVRSIAAAAEEQSAASEQITQATSEIHMVAGETSLAMNESSHAVSELATMSEELKAIIDEMTK